MSTIKITILSILLLTGTHVFSQSTEPVFMKWKLKPGETIAYKTIMQEDTAIHNGFSMGNMFKGAVGDSVSATMNEVFKRLSLEASQNSYTTYLKERVNNVIGIEMYMKQNKQDTNKDTAKAGSDEQKFRDLMSHLSSGVTLRGAIYEDGGIESFYLNSGQRNLIAMLFGLPGKPVKVGDSWSLGINFISLDQNFICDSSYNKDQVRVVNIAYNHNEHIVTLKYDITESVKGNITSPFDNKPVVTTMNFSYQGLADFSIEKGRWVNYNCILSNMSTGIMSAQSVQRISLIGE